MAMTAGASRDHGEGQEQRQPARRASPGDTRLVNAAPDTAGGDARGRHWESVYSATAPTGVSWYQPEPAVSLTMIDALGIPRDAAIIDVGGGASTLADTLIERGFTDLSVLDLSATALDHARRRLAGDAHRVHWLHDDVLTWTPPRAYDLWHDRAVFHFLVDPSDRDRYLDTLDAAVSRDGQVIIATFAADGPRQCSGLPVARYDADALATAVGPTFTTVEARREDHRTPWGAVQPFTWVAFQRFSDHSSTVTPRPVGAQAARRHRAAPPLGSAIADGRGGR